MELQSLAHRLESSHCFGRKTEIQMPTNLKSLADILFDYMQNIKAIVVYLYKSVEAKVYFFLEWQDR